MNAQRNILAASARAEQAELIALVRRWDYDRFLAIQLAPKAKRAALYALTALHVEVARIAETVSEPLIGHIRLAWWREALEEIMAGKPPRNHPVVQAAAQLYNQHPAVFPLLLAMIEARAADFDDSLLAEESAWLAYCDATAGSVHLAWAMVLDEHFALTSTVTIRSHARAYAMIGLVRAIPFMAQHGWQRFPVARIQEHQLESLDASINLNGLVKAVTMDAMGAITGDIDNREFIPLIASVKLARFYAKKLKKTGYNPYALNGNKLGPAWLITKLNFL